MHNQNINQWLRKQQPGKEDNSLLRYFILSPNSWSINAEDLDDASFDDWFDLVIISEGIKDPRSSLSFSFDGGSRTDWK